MQFWTVCRDFLIWFFGNLIDDIQTESSNTFVHPPKNHIVNLPSDLWIFPVQVRLFYRKLMEIILTKLRYPFPGRTAKGCLHIIREHSFLTITPDIVVVVRIILAFLRLLKPT